MSGYTKGPWKASFEIQTDGSVEAFHVTDSCGDSLLGACSCCNGTYVQGDGKANATLIAAAPDLLEALEDLVRHQEVLGRHNTIIDKARSAIAKARGEA